jgi:zinc protease
MRKTFLISLVCLSMLAGCATFRARPLPVDRSADSEAVVVTGPARPFDFQEITLDNGLRVVTMEDFSSPIVAVHVWYHVGSKNEDPNRQGFAHMFEHMMFRGTEVLGPEDHFKLIRGVGGTNNGFTSFDYTAYVNSVPSNQLELALWLEAERMMFLDISQEGFETERNVVAEERRQNYLNVPYGTVPERILPVVCKKHPYRWLPIGKIAHLEAAALDELRHFWDTYYVPANATLVIVGAVPHEEAREAARRYFGWMPKLQEPPQVAVREPEQTEERRITVRERLGPIPAAAYAYRTVEGRHPDSIPVEMTLRILAGGESSRLHLDLVKKRKLCALIYSQDFTLEQHGVIGIVGALHPVRYILSRLNPLGFILGKLGLVNPPHAAIFEAFDEHIEKLQQDGPTQRELNKVKNQMLTEAVIARRTVDGKAAELGETGILHGQHDWLNRRLDAIASVTREDIQRIARKYLAPSQRTVVEIVPDRRYVYDPNAGLDPDDYEPPKRVFVKGGIVRPAEFPAAPPIGDLLEEMPEIQVEGKVLDNGLKVVAIPNHEVPLASVVLALRHGAWTDEPRRPGVASMTLSMLAKGTEKYTAEELAEIIEFNALNVYGSAAIDTATVVAMGLSQKLTTAMELMGEVVLRPTFPRTELGLLKKQREVELMYQEKEPGYRASSEMRRRIFGDHPYARVPTGRRKDVGRIRRGHLVKWWNTFARPDAAVLYIAGDVAPDRAFALAEQHFGGWIAASPMPEVDLPPLPERQSTHIYLVDNRAAAQSEIRVGQTGISLYDPDYHKAGVFSQIFGGAFSSRLNKAIRIEGGRTYGAHGGFSSGRFGGRFVSSTSTRTESTARTVRDMLAVIESMRTNPATDDELRLAQRYLVGRVPSRYETAIDVVNAQLHIELNGLPKDNLQRSLAEYKATETGDIARIATEHVDRSKLTIVVVGDARKVKEELETIAPVTVVR